MENDPFRASAFAEVNPRDQMVCAAIRHDAAYAASKLANTWYARATPDLRDPEIEAAALHAVLHLERYSLSETRCILDLPVLPFYGDNFDVATALASVDSLLPFDAHELAVLRTQASTFDASTNSDIPVVLMERWRDWLRENESGQVSPEAAQLHDVCAKLYYALDAILPS